LFESEHCLEVVFVVCKQLRFFFSKILLHVRIFSIIDGIEDGVTNSQEIRKPNVRFGFHHLFSIGGFSMILLTPPFIIFKLFALSKHLCKRIYFQLSFFVNRFFVFLLLCQNHTKIKEMTNLPENLNSLTLIIT